MSKIKTIPDTHNVMFFDGVCGLCNHWVNFILAIDKKQRIKFSPLQGEFAKNYLNPDKRLADTISYLEGNLLYTKSTAVLRILRHVGGPWVLPYVFIIIPAGLRNFVYDLVAKNRYKFFGKLDVCRMPGPGEKDRFID